MLNLDLPPSDDLIPITEAERLLGEQTSSVSWLRWSAATAHGRRVIVAARGCCIKGC
jgi:hypothetical protein